MILRTVRGWEGGLAPALSRAIKSEKNNSIFNPVKFRAELAHLQELR